MKKGSPGKQQSKRAKAMNKYRSALMTARINGTSDHEERCKLEKRALNDSTKPAPAKVSKGGRL